MANILKQTCDACSMEINQYQYTRCIALKTNDWLKFKPWNDDEAQVGNAIHFHSDRCAKAYLEKWLLEQRVVLETPDDNIEALEVAAKAKLYASAKVVDAEFEDVQAPETATDPTDGSLPLY